MIRILLLIFTSLLYATQTYATPYGLSLSYAAIPKDPDNLHGYRIAAIYQPPSFQWSHFDIYFDASYGHWWIPGGGPYSSINSYAIAPYVRFYLIRQTIFSPYAEISIGPTYLSKTRIGCRNQGMHFSFQDQATIGSAFGKEQRLYASITVLHYSNGSFCGHNSGITIPMMVNLGYRF